MRAAAKFDRDVEVGAILRVAGERGTGAEHGAVIAAGGPRRQIVVAGITRVYRHGILAVAGVMTVKTAEPRGNAALFVIEVGHRSGKILPAHALAQRGVVLSPTIVTAIHGRNPAA